MAEQNTSCPICNSGSVIYQRIPKNKSTIYFCKFCGNLKVKDINGVNELNRHIIAGYLFETHITDEIREINPETIEKILSDPRIPKTSIEKFNKLLLSYYDILNSGIGFFNTKNYPPSIAYAENLTQIDSMIQALIKEGYLSHTKIDKSTGDPIDLHFTLKGLEYCESLLSSNNSKTVFVAMKFGPEMHSLHENAIKPACKECGFTALTVDETEHNDDITDKIITEIKTSHFVVADFTDNNLGVYYEAGFAKGLGLKVIKTCKKSWFVDPTTDDTGNKINKLHFDIDHDNLILWENEEDLKERLANRIKATIL